MTWSNQRPGTRIGATPAREAVLPPVLSRQAQDGLVELGLRRGKTTCDVRRQVFQDSIYGGGDREAVVTTVGTFLVDIDPVTVPVEDEEAGAIQQISGWNVSGFPRDADVRGSDRLSIPGWLPSWEANKAVALKYRVVKSGEFGNGHFYTVIQAGTTGTTEPDWSVQDGARVSDGTVVWQESGLAFTLEVQGTDDKKTSASQLVVRAEEIK